MIFLDCYGEDGKSALIIGLSQEDWDDHVASDAGFTLDLSETPLAGSQVSTLHFVMAEDHDGVKAKLNRMGVPVDEITDAIEVSTH